MQFVPYKNNCLWKVTPKHANPWKFNNTNNKYSCKQQLSGPSAKTTRHANMARNVRPTATM